MIRHGQNTVVGIRSSSSAYAAQLWGLLTPEERWAAHIHAQLGAPGDRKERKEEMEDPKTYEVSVSLKIRDGESYSQASIASVSVTDQVPPGVDPVAHLRSLIGREFKRKFSDLELPYEDNPVFDGGN